VLWTLKRREERKGRKGRIVRGRKRGGGRTEGGIEKGGQHHERAVEIWTHKGKGNAGCEKSKPVKKGNL